MNLVLNNTDLSPLKFDETEEYRVKNLRALLNTESPHPLGSSVLSCGLLFSALPSSFLRGLVQGTGMAMPKDSLLSLCEFCVYIL